MWSHVWVSSSFPVRRVRLASLPHWPPCISQVSCSSLPTYPFKLLKISSTWPFLLNVSRESRLPWSEYLTLSGLCMSHISTSSATVSPYPADSISPDIHPFLPFHGAPQIFYKETLAELSAVPLAVISAVYFTDKSAVYIVPLFPVHSNADIHWFLPFHSAPQIFYKETLTELSAIPLAVISAVYFADKSAVYVIPLFPVHSNADIHRFLPFHGAPQISYKETLAEFSAVPLTVISAVYFADKSAVYIVPLFPIYSNANPLIDHGRLLFYLLDSILAPPLSSRPLTPHWFVV